MFVDAALTTPFEKSYRALSKTFDAGCAIDSAKTTSQQVLLARSVAGRRRLAHLHLVEQLANVLVVDIEAFTLEDLDQKIATGTQYPTGKVERQFTEKHRTRHIDSAQSTHIGGHIGNHKVYLRITDRFENLLEDGVLGEIPPE